MQTPDTHTFITPQTYVTSEMVDRLYRLAEFLPQDWAGTVLADDFGSSMIAAVLRVLEKHGRYRADGSRRSWAEQGEFAEALLRDFWKRNAWRTASRQASALQQGKARECVSWDTIGEGAAATDLYAPLRDDLHAGETGRAVARFLEGLGWPRERAWAFVWRFSGREWDEVAFLLGERFEMDANPAQLRQWGPRHFEKVRPLVEDFLNGGAAGAVLAPSHPRPLPPLSNCTGAAWSSSEVSSREVISVDL